MEKSIRKLIAAVMALILAVVMVVTMSYAWMTLSTDPIAEGIQITIGGGNVIKIAPDVIVSADGKSYHHPGIFSSSLKFHETAEYAYLQEVGALSPVSTADGLHWFIPDYYDLTDEEIRNGEAVVGQLKNEFTLDTELAYANLSKEEQAVQGGGYVFLDFWVVSPASDYQLRVSRGDDAGGSYLLELMEPTETTDEAGSTVKYTLRSTSGDAAASARIGFLVNEDLVNDSTLLHYDGDDAEGYTKLKGVYHQPGESAWLSTTYRFTVYEPNGDLHSNGSTDYLLTEPLAWNGSEAVPTDISDRLTVQLSNSWRGQSDEGISLEELFQTAIIGDEFDSLDEVKYEFYHNYLQGQMTPYVNKGKFVKNTAALYSHANDGAVSGEVLSVMDRAGATDDVYIVTLEKNIPQRIRMFVWLEGQDADCTNAAGALDLALSIELAGSNQDVYEGTSTKEQNSQQNNQIAGITAPGALSLSLPVRSDTGAWEGLCNLWQVQLLPSGNGQYGADYLGRGPDRYRASRY